MRVHIHFERFVFRSRMGMRTRNAQFVSYVRPRFFVHDTVEFHILVEFELKRVVAAGKVGVVV